MVAVLDEPQEFCGGGQLGRGAGQAGQDVGEGDVDLLGCLGSQQADGVQQGGVIASRGRAPGFPVADPAAGVGEVGSVQVAVRGGPRQRVGVDADAEGGEDA